MSDFSKIDEVRLAARTIVRELGFLESTLAKTGLSPSGVHALIEIDRGAITANKLSTSLQLEKSTVSRLVKTLLTDGLLTAKPSKNDGRQMDLGLTKTGQKMLQCITDYGRSQVISAFANSNKSERNSVQSGLSLYAKALTNTEPPSPDNLQIISGYKPALLGRVTTMHAQFYNMHYGFGSVFERKVATEMAEFLSRIDRPENAVWSIILNNEIVGSLSIDGEDLGDGKAHLRWFVVDGVVRGTGSGRKLLSAAMQFVDDQKFTETHLWTFKGLDAARRLYEREGFELSKEKAGKQWGTKVREQHFIRRTAKQSS